MQGLAPKDIMPGMKFQILETLYNIDIDGMVSDKIDNDAFNGNLSAIYTDLDILQIYRNISKIVESGEKLLKDEIIEIITIEINSYDEITYIEFKKVEGKENGEVCGWPSIRLNKIKKL